MILTIVYNSGHFKPTSSAASIILRGRRSSHAHTTISQSTVDDDTASKGYVEQQPHSCRNIEASRSISCAKASCCLGEAVFEATDSPPLKRWLGRPYEGQNSHEVWGESRALDKGWGFDVKRKDSSVWPHWQSTLQTIKMSSAAVKDNKTANENDVAHNEVKKLLNVKSQQSVETCPHRKTPVSQDIGTLHYDCKSNRLMFIKIHENLMQKYE